MYLRGMQLVPLISVKKLSRILQNHLQPQFVVSIDDTLLEVAENGASVVLVVFNSYRDRDFINQ